RDNARSRESGRRAEKPTASKFPIALHTRLSRMRPKSKQAPKMFKSLCLGLATGLATRMPTANLSGHKPFIDISRPMKILRLGPVDSALAALTIRRLKPARTTKKLVREFLGCPDHYFIAALDQGQPIGFALAYAMQRIDRPRPMLFLYEIAVAET